MTRRGPAIRGRGNTAPPAGYRPGLKARWLRPRPSHTTPTQETDAMLVTPFITITYDQLPNDGDEIPGPSLPAGAAFGGIMFILDVLWAGMDLDPWLTAYVTAGPNNYDLLDTDNLNDSAVLGTLPGYNVSKNPHPKFQNMALTAPITTTIRYRNPGQGTPPSAGSARLAWTYWPVTFT